MTFYAKITNPKYLRVNLLAAAREMVVLISEQDKLKSLRRRKKLVLDELDTELSSMLESIVKLDEILPEKELKEELRRFEEETRKQEKSRATMKRQSKKRAWKDASIEKDIPPPMSEAKSISEIDRLEYTLNKIESKLKELGE